ncbi:MAG: type VI secretion system protein TssA [Rubrivivax sp.]|nr:type VI secretion system protein TssA [Rubrivivax sp.]MBK8527625.1 type VI secretion system protein TssA [Rubrivivax sp.]
MSEPDPLMSQVEAWLKPLSGDDGPCGPDLEYDNAFLELTTAAEGKPETQFDKGSPPEWRQVVGKVEALFDRTKDLRVALLWLRATLAIRGMVGLSAGLQLISGLLETQWDGLHPRPDPADNDPYARVNTLAEIPKVEGVLGEILNARLAAIKGVGELRLRDVEIAFNVLNARKGEATFSREQIEQMIADAEKDGAGVRTCLLDGEQQLKRLGALMDKRFGAGSGADLKPVRDALGRALSLAHEAVAEGVDEEGAPSDAGQAAGAAKPKSSGLSGSVTSRAEAMRAIDMVCEYLERTEPTNPAPLFLRRARGLLERNFLELLKDLAPAALKDVALSLGVDPATVGVPKK